MPDTNPSQTLDTDASEFRLNRFEALWMAWHSGEPMPRWQDHLPADDEPSSPMLIFDLLQMDIEFRVKAGLPALLAEPYFEHPCLQRENARLSAEQIVELIRWEYQHRRQIGQPARRADYQAAFPQHAEALRDLKATSRCPRCRKIIDVDEDRQTRHCPDCDGASPSINAAAPTEFDPRTYQLCEQLGRGGMGEVYRCCDPALGRDLAIKVMKDEDRGHPEAERRFLREARVTGSLQHPGIVPIHNLGRMSDGRLHYTMRLVRGQTFADILKEEGGKPERLPYLLGIFEKICQAVAYAHSKRVIHRDLKPANVMVGKFGEVQVMDWGLAKLLTPDDASADAEEMVDAVSTRIHTESPDTPGHLSRTGSGMGTPAYMPPEQALGEWDTVDERADVFALGSILCEMLTGQPAYRGTSFNEVYRRAKRGDVAEALERLDQCGADETLLALCRECLNPKYDCRPRDAGAVAKRVAEYQAAVQERLRQAELERVAAESRAKAEAERAREALARVKAERRAKRRMLALAVAVMVLIAGGGGAWWWKHLKQEQADREALASLERARERLEAGWRSNDVGKLSEALAEAKQAAAIARNGGASDAVEQQVAELQTEAQERLDRAEKNQELLRALLDIAIPYETKTYRESGAGQMVMALAEPSVEDQYANAFRRRWLDVDIDKQSAAGVAVRLQQEPEVVVQGVIAALDAWMLDRRREKRAEQEWRRLLGLVERLDASEPRQKLRALLIGSTPPSVPSVVGFFAASPSWPALWELARGKDWRHLRQLCGQMNAAEQPVMTVLLLAQASSAVGDMAGAEEVLKLALAHKPDEVALLDALGKVLERQGRLTEAIGCYRAIRAKNRNLGVALGRALVQSGQAAKGEAVLRDLLLRQPPNNPEMFFHLGNALSDQKKYAAAEAAHRKAIELKPDLAEAYYNLGNVLRYQREYAAAEAVYRKAIELKPDLAEAHCNLGLALDQQGKYASAEAAHRKAIDLKPDLLNAYINLGVTLSHQRKYASAEAAWRKAIDLKPNDAEAYGGLGDALKNQRKPAAAEAAYRKAIELKPDLAGAYGGLGVALSNQRKYASAEEAYRKAIDLKPDDAGAYYNLGNVLLGRGRYVDAEAAYRKAINLKPDLAEAHCNLGVALVNQRKHVAAEAVYRKAIDLKPDLSNAYINLGDALSSQGKYAAAEEAYRKAIDLKPDDAGAYYNLGNVLLGRGRYVDAEAAYRKAINLKPDLAEAHCNLGGVLQIQGRFTESLAAYRRGHELGSKQLGWRYPSPQMVRNAERIVELDKKLPTIIQGKASPIKASEAVSLAQFCQQPYKKLHAASARLYADAFALDAKLAADLNQQHRYNAACSAALAAAGQGEDARSLPDKVVAMFRGWALNWLRDDLKAYARRAEQNDPKVKQAIVQQMAHWRRDADLASVRDPQALERLADNERAVWQALWRDVDELAKRTAKTDETRDSPKKAKP